MLATRGSANRRSAARAMMPPDSIDERTIELIANRVAAVLRDELAEIAAQLVTRDDAHGTLTVDEVAERFGVARSTVYAHWQEWGGYKLGDSAKARSASRRLSSRSGPPSSRRTRLRRRQSPPVGASRTLISDAPRLDLRPEELS